MIPSSTGIEQSIWNLRLIFFNCCLTGFFPFLTGLRPVGFFFAVLALSLSLPSFSFVSFEVLAEGTLAAPVPTFFVGVLVVGVCSTLVLPADCVVASADFCFFVFTDSSTLSEAGLLAASFGLAVACVVLASVCFLLCSLEGGVALGPAALASLAGAAFLASLAGAAFLASLAGAAFLASLAGAAFFASLAGSAFFASFAGAGLASLAGAVFGAAFGAALGAAFGAAFGGVAFGVVSFGAVLGASFLVLSFGVSFFADSTPFPLAVFLA